MLVPIDLNILQLVLNGIQTLSMIYTVTLLPLAQPWELILSRKLKSLKTSSEWTKTSFTLKNRNKFWIFFGLSEKRQSGKRSYLVESFHWAFSWGRTEPSGIELHDRPAIQEDCWQWNCLSVEYMERWFWFFRWRRGVKCCWICHRISPKCFHHPFTSVQNLSTWCPYGSPLSLFLTVFHNVSSSLIFL